MAPAPMETAMEPKKTLHAPVRPKEGWSMMNEEATAEKKRGMEMRRKLRWTESERLPAL